jgi:hypothetical protein
MFHPQVKGESPTLMGPLEGADLNHWTQQNRCLSPHLMMETDPVSETLCSVVWFRMPVDGHSPKTQKSQVSYIIVRTF